jgi:hypothetical protein
VVVIVASAISECVRDILFSVAGQRVVLRLRKRLFQHMLQQACRRRPPAASHAAASHAAASHAAASHAAASHAAASHAAASHAAAGAPQSARGLALEAPAVPALLPRTALTLAPTGCGFLRQDEERRAGAPGQSF